MPNTNNDERGELMYNVKGYKVFHYVSQYTDQYDVYFNDTYLGVAKGPASGIAMCDAHREANPAQPKYVNDVGTKHMWYR
jgi:hypothetical protein